MNLPLVSGISSTFNKNKMKKQLILAAFGLLTFSTLVAQNAIPTLKGTALTMVNCIGFSITIISIQLINYVATIWNPSYIFMLLAIGPVLGLIALYKNTD